MYGVQSVTLCDIVVHTKKYIFGLYLSGDSDGKESACNAGDEDPLE